MIGFELIALLAALSAPGVVDTTLPPPFAVDTTRAGGSAVFAGAAPASVVDTLSEVRVERERLLSAARRRLPTAFVTDLRAGVSGRALESITEILEEAAGVRVVQYGGLGAFSTVSLRGAPPGHVAVYLDGAPLTSAAHGVASLADLPATAIDRVEVYRALSPLVFGPATPGGAINLVTVSSPDLREARLVRGSFGTWEARGSLGARRGVVSGLVHGGYQGSAGGYRFFDDNATGAEAGDDQTSVRINNQFDSGTALATVRVEPKAGLSARWRQELFHKRQGVPGLGTDQARHTRLTFQRTLSQLEVGLDGTGLRPDLGVTGSLQRERSRFRDLGMELRLGRHDSDDHLGSEQLGIELDWQDLVPWLGLQAAGSLRRESAELADPADGQPDPPESRRRGEGIATGFQLRPWNERLVLHAARRWDRIEDRIRTTGLGGSVVATGDSRVLDSPQAGIRLGIVGALELCANASRAERPPDFMELFGNQGSVAGNPALLPERGENWDAGASWSGALGPHVRASGEVARFESRSRDLIVYVRNSPSSVKAQNISRARVRGAEFSLRLAGPLGLSLSASATRQSSVDQGEIPFWRGRQLPQRPEEQAYARLDWRKERVRAGADVHYLGHNYLDRYNRDRVEARTLIGASLSAVPWLGGLLLTLEAKNLTDHRVHDVAGFPLPGRSLFASVQLRLGAAATNGMPPNTAHESSASGAEATHAAPGAAADSR